MARLRSRRSPGGRNPMHSDLHVLQLGLSPGALLILGNVLWVIAYLLIIRASFHDRIYGIPLLAICLNITWELFFFLRCPMIPPCAAGEEAKCLCPPLGFAGDLILGIWLLLDVVILYQLVWFGRPHQFIPEIRRFFWSVVAGTLLVAFFWHYSYITFYDDRSGVEDAWGINLVMSGLFILMLFMRPHLKGLSPGAAVAKMLGSAFNALGLLVMRPFPFPHHENPTMMYFLFSSVFFLDLAYIWLLLDRRQHAITSPATTGGAGLVS
jgi:hypothetical protein